MISCSAYQSYRVTASGHGVQTDDELKSPSRPLSKGQMEHIGPLLALRSALL